MSHQGDGGGGSSADSSSSPTAFCLHAHTVYPPIPSQTEPSPRDYLWCLSAHKHQSMVLSEKLAASINFCVSWRSSSDILDGKINTTLMVCLLQLAYCLLWLAQHPGTSQAHLSGVQSYKNWVVEMAICCLIGVLWVTSLAGGKTKQNWRETRFGKYKSTVYRKCHLVVNCLPELLYLLKAVIWQLCYILFMFSDWSNTLVLRE